MSNNIQQVTTGKVRLSYAHLFQPYAHQQGQEPKYSTTILVPKSDLATKQRIDAAIQAAVQAGIAEKWNGARPPILAVPIHDGDGPRPSDGMPFGEECRGHWVFTASSKNPVAIVDINMNPILSQTEIYSGIYARVSVQFFAYNSNGKKGIGCGLGPVQKLEDGEPLGGNISAEQAFGGANSYDSGYTQQFQQPVQQFQQPAPQVQYAAPQTTQQYIPPQQPYAPAAQPQFAQQQPAAPFNPQYASAPQQQQAVDPITGMPIGGVMGL